MLIYIVSAVVIAIIMIAMAIDVNPQFLSLKVVESGAATFTEAKINTPVLPQFSSSKALVMEILKVWFTINKWDGADEDFVGIQLTKQSATAILLDDDPDRIVGVRDKVQFVTSGVSQMILSPFGGVIYDLTDGDGNGFLVASKELFLSILGTSQASAITGTVKILYRLKQVGIKEYIGIVS